MLSMKRLTWPALAIMLAASPAIAQDPQTVKHASSAQQNQNLADTIASELKASGVLKNYRIDVTCMSGNVELCGNVADEGQRDEAIRLAQAVPGVVKVASKMSMTNPGVIKQAQADQPLPTPRKVEGMPGEPLPSYRAGMPTYAGQQQAPPLPPYAWPTYAPYNNYSRVAYPMGYPQEAFPFIGPVNPFPKVPLGWRSVKLEWEDGHWWLSSHSQQRDAWMLRYW
jgi:BON domain-containing protein